MGTAEDGVLTERVEGVVGGMRRETASGLLGEGVDGGLGCWIRCSLHVKTS